MSEPLRTTPPTSTRIDIAAYNEALKRFDSIIHHNVMRSDVRDTMFVGVEDFRYIAEVRSILVDAEKLLLGDRPAMCAHYLNDAITKIEWILHGRKRSRQTTVIRTALDSRVREQLEWCVGQIKRLITEVGNGR